MKCPEAASDFLWDTSSDGTESSSTGDGHDGRSSELPASACGLNVLDASREGSLRAEIMQEPSRETSGKKKKDKSSQMNEETGINFIKD